MTTKIINLYEFRELSDKAKEVARDWFLEDGTFFEENFKCEMDILKDKYKFKDFDVKVNSSFSQGDGATIETSNFFTKPILQELKEKLSTEDFDLMKKLIKNRILICYIHCKSNHSIYADRDNVYLHIEDEENIQSGKRLCKKINESFFDNIETAVMEVYSRICAKILAIAEHIQLDTKAVDECISANEYLFTEDGEQEDP